MSLRFALVGHPVSHSRSPTLQKAAFAASGIDADYEVWDVPPGDLPNLRARILAEPLTGGNVTVPHKAAFFALSDESDDVARALGAANVFVVRSGRISCANTDVEGFARALAELSGCSVIGRKVAVLGAGGSARAVVAALDVGRAAEIRVVHHRYAAKAALLEPRETTVRFAAYGPEHRATALSDADLVVNTTPLGMRPGDGPAVRPEETSARHLYDLVYPRAAGEETPTVAAFRAAGRTAASGATMLLYQGAASFEYWTGRPAQLGAMRAALGL